MSDQTKELGKTAMAEATAQLNKELQDRVTQKLRNLMANRDELTRTLASYQQSYQKQIADAEQKIAALEAGEFEFDRNYSGGFKFTNEKLNNGSF